jgi:xanthine dehydrogenase accessory factor
MGAGHASLGSETWHWGSDGQSALRVAGSESNSEVALRVTAPLKILLFGAGPETSPLHLFIRRLGWSLQVVEHRGRWLKFAQAAGVQQIIELPPDDATAVWRRQHVDAVIAMTHNYALDMKHLAACAATDISYIGLLGPGGRRDAMLAELGPEISSQLQGRLRSPVGLGLGGSGPETLALSIAAELQQHFAPARKPR